MEEFAHPCKKQLLLYPLLLLPLVVGQGTSSTFAQKQPLESLVNPRLFTDVDSGDVEVLYLAEFNIIRGYPDKTVRSDQPINRAEALTLFARLFELNPVYDPNCTFSDVPPSAWYAGYISAMCNQGLVSGYPDGTFRAANQINRAEAFKILLLGLKVDVETDFSHLPNNIFPNMWYAKYADYAIKRNLSPIIATDFHAEKLYTRGDLFLNMYRIKRLLELNEEIYSSKLDPVVIDEHVPPVTEDVPRSGTPDLVIKDIGVGGMGFGAILLDVNICNEGERAAFETITLKLNDEYKTFEDLTLNTGECLTTGYYGRVANQIRFTDIVSSWGDAVTIAAEIDPHQHITELNEKNNQLSKTIAVPLCGNDVCEAGENYGVCPFDCEVPCESEFCNEKVVVYCGCQEREYLLRGCTFNEPCMENYCKDQEAVFDDMLVAQTKVYDCLADYFHFESPRVPYVIYAERTPVCNVALGCPRPNTSRSVRASYIINPSTPGFVEHGELYVTKPIQLIVDEHEMTHYFLMHMLHSIPDWFNEGVAIQTDVRLNCDVKAHPFRSGIGYEKTIESGQAELSELTEELKASLSTIGGGVWLNEDGSITFGEKFYQDLKAGTVSIDPAITPQMYTPFGNRDPHFMGSLFMMGLKLDYQCTKDCVREIVLKLHEFEKSRCPGPACGIGLTLGARRGEEGINSAIIKKITNDVVGKDTSPLFTLLDLE